MSETIIESCTITAPSGAEYRLEYVLERQGADGAPGVADALDFADTMAALILEGK